MRRSPANAQPVLDWLAATGSAAVRDGMARFAIPSDKAFGVSVADLRRKAKAIGRGPDNHALAAALWADGRYEARMLATMVDDPARVSVAQMDRWCDDFDSWAICDTACFSLFDHAPGAWSRLLPWSQKTAEFGKRAAFAMLWSLSVHDKRAADAAFVDGLALVEQHAGDARNFVRKAVNMALRAVGKRNAVLHAEALTVAQRLAASADATRRWVGKDALRELQSASVQQRLVRRQAATARAAPATETAKSAAKPPKQPKQPKQPAKR